MQLVRFLVALLVTTALTILASMHAPFGSRLPAVGPFFSPFGGFWQNGEHVGKYTDEKFDLPGLKAPAEVVFDERGVPHVFASSMEDLCYLQGYLVARDRLWQMDISVRATAGRLAEVMGERVLSRDRIQRRKGLLTAAERALRLWEKQPEEWALIQAYTAGANAYISNLPAAKYPLEFKLLGYEPEPWTPLHTAVIFKSMAETLSARHEDLQATYTRQLVGDSLFQFLYPERNPDQSPIIPESVNWDFEPVPVGQPKAAQPASEPMMSQQMPHLPLPQPPPFIGSNNWAVAGSKTASGNPILCNDPHLTLTLPSIWYEMQLQAPGVNTYGVALPGVPGLLIGFNENVAWGETNVGQDVMDWYRIAWTDRSREAYRWGTQTKPVEKVVEVIQVRGREKPVLDTVRYTEWGPVVYEDPEHPYYDLAMHWLAMYPTDQRDFYELGTFFRLMQAEGLPDYLEALKGFENPAQNFAFASKDGDIAITANGKLPLKNKPQGRFVQDGSDPANAWGGFIPHEHLPRVVNPERGFIASANQRSTGPDYPYYYNGYFDDYRGRYLNRRLEEMNQIQVEDLQALQLDNYSLEAEEGATLLMQLLDSTDTELRTHPAVQQLREWDFRFEPDAEAPTLYERWMEAAFRQTFDELPSDGEAAQKTLYPETWRFLALLRDTPGHALFDHQDTETIENASDIVRQALEGILTQDYEPQTWNDYSAPFIAHLGRIPAFARNDMPVGGFHNALNAINGGKGPSWRMVVELGDRPNAFGVYPGGPSGNPGSPFYDNTVDEWANGEYHPLYLMESPADERVAPLYQFNLEPTE
jgi:penicillin G amidase